MIDEKIRCCHLMDTFVRRYRDLLCIELVHLGDAYVMELRGLLHLDETGGKILSSCGSGCVGCGPAATKEEKPGYRTAPFETVWRVCPFCGGNFVRD